MTPKFHRDYINWTKGELETNSYDISHRFTMNFMKGTSKVHPPTTREFWQWLGKGKQLDTLDFNNNTQAKGRYGWGPD